MTASRSARRTSTRTTSRRRFSPDSLRWHGCAFAIPATEANLLALATARAVSGKPNALIFGGAYHGSLLYYSHGASPLNMPIPVIESVYNDPERAVRDIAANASTLAAVILEPMQGGAGRHSRHAGIPQSPARRLHQAWRACWSSMRS